MKNLVVAFMFMFIGAFAIGQTPEGEEIRELPDGGIEVYGIDKLGASVIVRYDSNGDRVYQERSTNEKLIYAFFNKGVVIRHGEQDLKQGQNLSAQ